MGGEGEGGARVGDLLCDLANLGTAASVAMGSGRSSGRGRARWLFSFSSSGLAFLGFLPFPPLDMLNDLVCSL